MSYNKDRIKRKKVLNFLNKIKIRTRSFGFSDLTILISIILIIFSISTPWISIINGNAIEGFFSGIFGITAYISLFLIFINIFILFSSKTKQKIKLFFNSNINDNSIFIFSSILFLIFSLNSFFIIKNGIPLFTNDIKIHVGITFYLIASILYTIGIFLKLNFKKNNSDFVSINESEEKNNLFNKSSGEHNNTGKGKNKKNVMKLPFE